MTTIVPNAHLSYSLKELYNLWNANKQNLIEAVTAVCVQVSPPNIEANIENLKTSHATLLDIFNAVIEKQNSKVVIIEKNWLATSLGKLSALDTTGTIAGLITMGSSYLSKHPSYLIAVGVVLVVASQFFSKYNDVTSNQSIKEQIFASRVVADKGTLEKINDMISQGQKLILSSHERELTTEQNISETWRRTQRVFLEMINSKETLIENMEETFI